MTIAGRAVLVTGANRGIGRALVEEALERGVSTSAWKRWRTTAQFTRA